MDNSTRQGGERGAAAVEMAILTVFLLILALGIADLGRALFTSIGVQDAAQEGAIYGSFEPSDTAEIINRAVAATTYPQLNSSNVIVTCPGDSVAVQVSYELDLITPIVGQWFGGSITLSREFVGEVFIGTCTPS